MNYLFDPDFLAQSTAEAKNNLKQNNGAVDFVEFASQVIYERLKKDIRRYRVYGPYWWALKDVLRRQGYNVGEETDSDVSRTYKGADDAQTIVAADLFYLDMSNQVTIDNNAWALDPRADDYILYDADMEERTSINQSVLA